jgi:hypothetical protein
MIISFSKENCPSINPNNLTTNKSRPGNSIKINTNNENKNMGEKAVNLTFR